LIAKSLFALHLFYSEFQTRRALFDILEGGFGDI